MRIIKNGNDKLRRMLFEMRHDAYRQNRFYISPIKSFIDQYDYLPHCNSHLLYERGNAIASLRLSIHSPARGMGRLPAMDIFPNEIHSLLTATQAIAEFDRVTLVGRRRLGLLAHKPLFAAALEAALVENCSDVIVVVLTKDCRLSTRAGFRQVSNPKVLPIVKAPVVLMQQNASECLARLKIRGWRLS